VLKHLTGAVQSFDTQGMRHCASRCGPGEAAALASSGALQRKLLTDTTLHHGARRATLSHHANRPPCIVFRGGRPRIRSQEGLSALNAADIDDSLRAPAPGAHTVTGLARRHGNFTRGCSFAKRPSAMLPALLNSPVCRNTRSVPTGAVRPWRSACCPAKGVRAIFGGFPSEPGGGLIIA
jgi:hypothetical protein